MSLPYLLARFGAWIALVCFICIAGGCSSSSSSAKLRVVEITADGAGTLPETGLYLNGALRVRFNRAIDPASITDDTFRIDGGAQFDLPAVGDIVLRSGGKELIFLPRLPELADLSDVGLVPGERYRLSIVGADDGAGAAPTVTTPGGKPLTESIVVDFGVRDFEPYFIDVADEAPAVVAIRIDLDGDGSLDAAEEFAGPFSSGVSFVDGVRTGSRNLPAPDGPLRIGIVLSEPIDPRSVFADLSSSVSSEAALLERDRLAPCAEGMPGAQCPVELPVSIRVRNEFSDADGAYLSMVELEAGVALKSFEAHLITLGAAVEDLAGTTIGTPLEAAFTTGEAHELEDFLVETFADRSGRDPSTTALWAAFDSEFLQSGYGWGGDGSDGDFLVTANTVLDTTGNDGIWNFNRVTFENAASIRFEITGDKPAVIRVFDELLILGSTTLILLDGEDGRDGEIGSALPVPGGAAGAGGGRGGDASIDFEKTMQAGSGVTAFGFADGAGAGGFSGGNPGGGGGAAHVFAGNDGTAGDRGSGEPGGGGGLEYGEEGMLSGGSGGGAGGNQIGVVDVSSGGGGGGGGGAVLFDVRGFFGLRAPSVISAEGGRGGRGARSMPDGSASGGGGSGGTVIIRTSRVIATTGRISAVGGIGGLPGLLAGRGGNGSDGRIRVETIQGSQGCNCSPNETIARIDDAILGVSRATSRFQNTNFLVGESVFGFDASDPLTGEILYAAGVEDIVLVDADGAPIEALPDGVRAFILFSGADELPEAPGQPDPATITPWSTDISSIDGRQMIRYRIRFEVDEELLDRSYRFPGVDDVRLRYSR